MMKPRGLVITIIGLALFIPSLSFAQFFNLGLNFQMEDIRSVVLEDFEDNDNNWQVSASRFTDEDYPIVRFGIEGAPIALSRVARGEENKFVMGVRSAFVRKGYNKIWLYPGEEIVIPGNAKKVDVWVWGANYYYTLYVHLRDYRGIVHKLPLGSLHYMGWRNLSVEIPRQIPQAVRYLPMEKPLSLVRFEIWTDPNERVDDYVIYFDHLKVLTDMYKQRFDGDELADRTKDIWSSQ
jgi:hypothetical protein